MRDVRELLNGQDLFLSNFEGVIVSESPLPETCRKRPFQSLLYSPPQIADVLHPSQQAIATLANNHILDCGELGIRRTMDELARRGIRTVGAGENLEQACQPVRLLVQGIRVAIVAYLAIEGEEFYAGANRAGAASWENCDGVNQLAKLAATEDFIIVALHLHVGPSWTDQTSPEHLDLVQRVLDAGADVVLAHGPHVPQGILERNGGLALLSLGNFLFHPDYPMPEKAHRSVIAKMSISSEQLVLTVIPLILDDSGRPRIPTPQDASVVLQDIAALSATLGTKVEIRNGVGYVTLRRR